MMLVSVLLCLMASLWSATAVDWNETTPLDEYVWRDDGAFTWEEKGSYRYNGVTVYFVNMTSQIWMDENFSNHPLWYHWVTIAIPDEILFEDAGVLAITGGGNNIDDEIPPEDDPSARLLALFANITGTVAGFVAQIPNQPIEFVGDDRLDDRREDDLIAWTWRKFLESNGTQTDIPARMPMTKGAKRALDTINELTLQKTGNNITRFAVGGGSKRGWTTWSLAAVDKRVVAMVPIVMSLLNFPETLMHHFRSMDGGWSFALEPYFSENLTYYLLDPISDELWKHEDPYTYKERFTIPKLVISGTGDEFFLLTDSHHWWNDLPGDMWFMMIPNAQHSLAPHYIQIARCVIAVWKAFLNDIEIPKVGWTRETYPGGGRLVMNATEPPTSVLGWRAETLDNTTRRDFRLNAGTPGDISVQPVFWRRDNVTELNDVTFEYVEEEVDGEWVGTVIEAKFDGPDGYEMTFTTEVNMIPDTFPAEPCTGRDCYGKLV